MQLRDETGRPDPPPILDLVSAWLAALMWQRDEGLLSHLPLLRAALSVALPSGHGILSCSDVGRSCNLFCLASSRCPVLCLPANTSFSSAAAEPAVGLPLPPPPNAIHLPVPCPPVSPAGRGQASRWLPPWTAHARGPRHGERVLPTLRLTRDYLSDG